MLSVLIKICCFLSVVLQATSEQATRDINDYRLPINTQPVWYDLWLSVNLPQFMFVGVLTINLFVSHRDNYVELNCKDLTIFETSVILEQDAMPFQLVSFQMDDTTEKCRFEFDRELTENANANLTMRFSGTIRTDLKGLYATSYNVGLQRRNLVATQFEATYARMVFPCYDEPGKKAIFKIKISHDPNLNAISNMPQISREVVDVLAITTFEDTPIMSTYILAFVVSDYKFVEMPGGRFRVFVPEHELANAEYALSFTQDSLKFLEDYIGVDYSLPKLDLIALPELRFGAMENWGLITFRSDVLLFDSVKTPARVQQTISTLITHELVHTWFGNFVTPEWWKYLWLSEGFAEYYEMYVTSHLKPSWRVLDQFNLIVQSALAQDDKWNVRAMTRELVTPAELNAAFDYVVYAKSASVIRMMKTTLGKEEFQSALGSYIGSRLHGTTNPDFLFEHLQRFATVPLPTTVKLIFESWSDNPGYPVVQATRSYDTGKVTISQKRFFTDSTTSAPERYYVPITMTDGETPNFELNPTVDLWLTPAVVNTVIDFDKKESWLLLNKQQNGYYRVNYDLDNWELLINELEGPNYTRIHVLNRAALVDDAFNLAKGGHIEHEVALDVLSYLRQENDFIPWSSGYNAFTFLMRMLRGSSKYEYLEAFIRNVTAHSYEATGYWTMQGDHVTEVHRSNILYLACFAGMTDCVATAREVVTRMLEDTSYHLPENVQPAAFCAVAKYDDVILNRLISQLNLLIANPLNPDKKLMYRFFGSLGCTRNEEILMNALTLSIMPAPPGIPLNIDGKDRQEIFRAITSGTTVGTRMGLEMMRTRYLDFSQRYNSMETLFQQLAPNLVTDELRTLFNAVVNDNRIRFETEAILKAAEQAQQEAVKLLNWSNWYLTKIENWLENKDLNLDDGEGDGGGTSVIKTNLALLVMLVFMLFRLG